MSAYIYISQIEWDAWIGYIDLWFDAWVRYIHIYIPVSFRVYTCFFLRKRRGCRSVGVLPVARNLRRYSSLYTGEKHFTYKGIPFNFCSDAGWRWKSRVNVGRRLTLHRCLRKLADCSDWVEPQLRTNNGWIYSLYRIFRRIEAGVINLLAPP